MMPITVNGSVRRLTQAEFGAIAFEVMGVLYRLQNDLGRFFNERVYKQALQASIPGVEVEVPIKLSWRDFKTTRFLDVLVGGGAAFEFKMVDRLANSHRAQLLNYLMLLELAHGKLVNLKPSRVEEEFVNTTLRHSDRLRFQVDDSRYQTQHPTACLFRDSLIELLNDWGTCLELGLYTEAMTHSFGGPTVVERDVEVIWNGRRISHQSLRLAGPNVAYELTALESAFKEYEDQAQRLLDHTPLSPDCAQGRSGARRWGEWRCRSSVSGGRGRFSCFFDGLDGVFGEFGARLRQASRVAARSVAIPSTVIW